MARDLLNGIIDHEEQSDVTAGQETAKINNIFSDAINKATISRDEILEKYLKCGADLCATFDENESMYVYYVKKDEKRVIISYDDYLYFLNLINQSSFPLKDTTEQETAKAVSNSCNVCGNIKKSIHLEKDGKYYCQRCAIESAAKTDETKYKLCFICGKRLPGFYRLDDMNPDICERCEEMRNE
jgi:hypothetical protein